MFFKDLNQVIQWYTKEAKPMNVVSQCCHAPIVEGYETHYPLGGRKWGVPHRVELCEKCEGEANPVEVCECCGEEFDNRGPIKTELGEWCATCVAEEVDKRTEQIKREWGCA